MFVSDLARKRNLAHRHKVSPNEISHPVCFVHLVEVAHTESLPAWSEKMHLFNLAVYFHSEYPVNSLQDNASLQFVRLFRKLKHPTFVLLSLLERLDDSVGSSAFAQDHSLDFHNSSALDSLFKGGLDVVGIPGCEANEITVPNEKMCVVEGSAYFHIL